MNYILAICLIYLALTFALTINAEEWFVRSMNHSLVKKRDVNSLITFYEDDQLNNAACYGRDGLPNYNAKPSDRIGAILNDGMCYQCVKITNPENSKSVVVKIIDKCAGCKKNQIDLTKSSFASIANPDDGIVKVTWKGVSCPSSGRFPTFEKKKNKKN
ncbi:hypothetical protein RclHR1_01860002 [Rhizophagus clarus]|uniref:RlpA-like double-psi beta-barrel-protein domain-containing protein-containing protein n=1 Tax=Rhizophagus clarus TaxID=94130 RepID=A0A2Z6RFV8_9GLOM|nr:hypothetical protein RclHR1_01860002 [Rhizophagus clarus]GES79478.1 RlpA-like double-psi beta-barrel-protein domain-containing protein-containing protein [Rhizophagus clarus]